MSTEVLARDVPSKSASNTKPGIFKKFWSLIMACVNKIKEMVRKIILTIRTILKPSQRAEAANELIIMEYRKIITKIAKSERETLDISTIPGLSTYTGKVSNDLSDSDIDKGADTLKTILKNFTDTVKKAFTDISAEAEKLISKDAELAKYEKTTISTFKEFNAKNDHSNIGRARADMDKMRELAVLCNRHVVKIQEMYKQNVLSALAVSTKSQGKGLHSTVKEIIITLLKKHAGKIIEFCRDGTPVVGNFLRKIENRAHELEKTAQFLESYSDNVKSWASSPAVASNPSIANNCKFVSTNIYYLSQICMQVSRNYSVVTTYVGKNLGNYNNIDLDNKQEREEQERAYYDSINRRNRDIHLQNVNNFMAASIHNHMFHVNGF